MNGMKIILTATVLSVCAVSAQAANYTLRIGSGHTTGLTYVNEFDTYFIPEVTRRVKEKTGDNIRFIKAWGGSVAKVDATIEAVQKNTFDIGLLPIGFEPSRAALLNYSIHVPFASPDPILQRKVAQRMMNEVPALQESMNPFNSHILALMSSEAYGLSTSFDWNTLAGLRGKRIGMSGANAPMFTPLGVIPVTLGIGEHYQATQTKLIDGSMYYISGMEAFKLKETSKFWNKTGHGSLVVTTALMNTDTRTKLPPRVVQIIDAVALETADRVGEVNKKRDLDVEANVKTEGIKISTLPEAERIRWAQLLIDVPAKAAKDLDARGMPGTQVLKTYIQFMREEGYEFPVDYPL